MHTKHFFHDLKWNNINYHLNVICFYYKLFVVQKLGCYTICLILRGSLIQFKGYFHLLSLSHAWRMLLRALNFLCMFPILWLTHTSHATNLKAALIFLSCTPNSKTIWGSHNVSWNWDDLKSNSDSAKKYKKICHFTKCM